MHLFSLLFSAFMSKPDATFCHPDQATRHEHYYNDNYSIPNSSKIWDFRDSLFIDKNGMAIFQNGDLEAFCQKGANAPEFFHANSTDCFDYLRKEQVHIDRMPAVAAMQKLAHNLKRARLIQRRVAQAKIYDPEYYHIHEQILKKLESLISLNSLRNHFRTHDQSPHHFLYFENTHKCVDAFLYGFKWQNSLCRVTSFDHHDKELLWQYIEKHKSELENKHGSCYHPESLKFLRKKLKYKISTAKLKLLIYKYWIIDDDLFHTIIQELKLSENDEYQNEVDDIDCKLIETDYDTSPCKGKKKPKYVRSTSDLISTHHISSHVKYIVTKPKHPILNIADQIIHIHLSLMTLAFLNKLENVINYLPKKCVKNIQVFVVMFKNLNNED